jgi:acyl-CoA thioester hydrolase
LGSLAVGWFDGRRLIFNWRLFDYRLFGYNPPMTDYNFFHPTEVRYGDLDPQGHVNNAKYLTYFEQARIYYLIKLGLFSKDQSFMEVGLIVADIHITYHSTTHYGDVIKVGVKTTKIGNKSLTIEQCVMDANTGKVMASGTVIMVTFDYEGLKTVPVPDEWKKRISEFEGI